MNRKRVTFPNLLWNNLLEKLEQEKLHREDIINENTNIQVQTKRKSSIYLPPINGENKRNEFKKSLIKNRYSRVFNGFFKSNLLSSYEQNTEFKTGQLKPSCKFPKLKVLKIIKDYLNDFCATHLKYTPYDPKAINSIRRNLADLSSSIKDDVRQYSDKRYRLIVNCTLGEIKNQDLIMGSKYLWDDKTDVSLTVNHIHEDKLFIICNLFAVYKE
jgi:hypothetical protein